MIERLFDDSEPSHDPACEAARKEVLEAETAVQMLLGDAGFPALERLSQANAQLLGASTRQVYTQGFCDAAELGLDVLRHRPDLKQI